MRLCPTVMVNKPVADRLLSPAVVISMAISVVESTRHLRPCPVPLSVMAIGSYPRQWTLNPRRPFALLLLSGLPV